jgi:hypothetical protein
VESGIRSAGLTAEVSLVVPMLKQHKDTPMLQLESGWDQGAMRGTWSIRTSTLAILRTR